MQIEAVNEVVKKYKASLAFLDNKETSNMDKIVQMKKLINEQLLVNKNLVSKANRFKFESEKTFALI